MTLQSSAPECAMHGALSRGWVYLDVLFCHLNFGSVDVVDQLTQRLAIHILDFYLLGFTLRHVTYSPKQKQMHMKLAPMVCLIST